MKHISAVAPCNFLLLVSVIVESLIAVIRTALDQQRFGNGNIKMIYPRVERRRVAIFRNERQLKRELRSATS